MWGAVLRSWLPPPPPPHSAPLAALSHLRLSYSPLTKPNAPPQLFENISPDVSLEASVAIIGILFMHYYPFVILCSSLDFQHVAFSIFCFWFLLTVSIENSSELIPPLIFYSCEAVSWAELYCGAIGFFCFMIWRFFYSFYTQQSWKNHIFWRTSSSH